MKGERAGEGAQRSGHGAQSEQDGTWERVGRNASHGPLMDSRGGTYSPGTAHGGSL